MKFKGNIQQFSSTEIDSFYSDSGSANAYAVTLIPAISSYTTGLRFLFKPSNSNTGASTINVNGLGVKSIKKDNVDLANADITANRIYDIVYDGINFQLIHGEATSDDIDYLLIDSFRSYYNY